MGHYLDRLTRRQSPGLGRRARERAVRALPSTNLLVIVGLLASVSLTAAALAHLVDGTADGRVRPSASTRCLSASVTGLAVSGARGRARLCVAEANDAWELVVEHLTSGAGYAGWWASFEQPGLCRFGALAHYAPGFRQPCTLADLGGPDSQAHPLWLADATADTSGTVRFDGLVGDALLPPHAETWLLVGPASLLHATPAQADWIARAVFDLP